MPDRHHLRRMLAALRRDHRDAMPHASAAVSGTVLDPGAPAGVKDAAVGFDRRGFIRLGGVGVASGLVLAACGSDGEAELPPAIPQSGETTTTAEPFDPGEVDDAVLLRTASSIEYLAIDAYTLVLEAGLFVDPLLVEAAELFRSQHSDHADFFAQLTEEVGGEPYLQANPVVADRVVAPRLSEVTDQPSAAALAYDLEQVAAQTYQRNVRTLTTSDLRQASMSVGGIEARHAAVLAPFVPAEDGGTLPTVASAFGPTVLALGPASFIYAGMS